MKLKPIFLATVLVTGSLTGCSLQDFHFDKESIKDLLPSALQNLKQEEESTTEAEEAEKTTELEETTTEETTEQETVEEVTPAIDTGISEDALKAIVTEEYGDSIRWEYHDYDYDGKYEAFALVMGGNSILSGQWEDSVLNTIVFVASDGTMTEMTDVYDYDGYGPIMRNDSPRYFQTEMYSQDFFNIDTVCGDGSSESILLSVKDGVPYQIELSNECELFRVADGALQAGQLSSDVATQLYTTYALNFDESTGQFSYGDVVGTNKRDAFFE